MCYGLVVQLVSTVDKILTDSISPGSSAVTELLVPLWYRLTRVVLEKGCETCVWATVNVCVCVLVRVAGHPLAQNERCLHMFLLEPSIDKDYVPGKVRTT